MSKLPRRSVTNAQAAAEEPVELENHFILRLPADTAQKVRSWLQEGGAAFKDKLYIQFQPDMRNAQVKVDDETFYGKLVDLPCVVETLKTLDKKTFYKVTDLAQMLVCRTDVHGTDAEQKQKDQRSLQKLEELAKDPKKKDKQYQWPHGITPPLKNVRKRRFRKTLKKKYMDAPELEKELKRLLREDMEAVRVRWEIVTSEQEAQQKMKAQKQKLQEQESTSTQVASEQPISRVDELFGGALSSSSSDGDASDVEPILDSDADNDVTLSSVGAATPRRHQESESGVNAGFDVEEAEGRELARQLLMSNSNDADG